MLKKKSIMVLGVSEIVAGFLMIILAISACSTLKNLYAKKDVTLVYNTLDEYQKSVASFKKVYLQMNLAIPELEKSMTATQSMIQSLHGPADMLLNITQWKVPLTKMQPFKKYQGQMQAFKDELPRLDAAFGNAIGSLQRYQNETTPATVSSLDQTLQVLQRSQEKVNLQNAVNHRIAVLVLFFGILMGLFMAGNGFLKITL